MIDLLLFPSFFLYPGTMSYRMATAGAVLRKSRHWDGRGAPLRRARGACRSWCVDTGKGRL